MLKSIYQSHCNWWELQSFWTWYWIRVQVKKLVISSTVTEVKIISLCNLDEILLKENYFDKSFLVDTLLILQNESFNLCSLIDSDSVIYTIIHINLINRVCKELKIQSISLTKEKLIKEYDEKIFKKTITHKILLNLIIESHKKLTVSMLIADINHHEVILEKSWMNKNEILLNMQIDVIVFSNQLDTVRIMSRWVNQRKSGLNSAWSLEIAITEILRIQKKSKRVSSCIYSRAKQRGRSRFAWVSKALE